MSDTIRVLRISEPGRVRGGASAVTVVDIMLEQLGESRSLCSRWGGLPAPGDDRHIVLGHPLCIRDTEVCGVVDERQLINWWPEWAISALSHPSAEHDVRLEVFDVPAGLVRIGGKQTVFNRQAACPPVISIPLARTGMSYHDLVTLLNNQDALVIARREYSPWTRVSADDEVKL